MGKFTIASPSQQLYRNEGSFDHSSIGKEMHLDGVSLFGQSQTLFAVLVAAVLWHFSTKPNFISVDYNWGSNHNHNKCLVGKNAAATALYTWLNPRRDECVVQCCVEQLLLHTTLLALLFRCNIDTHICRVEEKNCFLYLDVGRDMEVCVPAKTTFGSRVNHFQLQLKFVWILYITAARLLLFGWPSGAVTRRMRVTAAIWLSHPPAEFLYIRPLSSRRNK